jgi:hypothetical protein
MASAAARMASKLCGWHAEGGDGCGVRGGLGAPPGVTDMAIEAPRQFGGDGCITPLLSNGGVENLV